MCEFFAPALQITPILLLYGILDGTGYRMIDAKDEALTKLDFSGGVTANIIRSTRSLPLPPGFSGTRLASFIGGWHAARNTKGSGRVIQSGAGWIGIGMPIVSGCCSMTSIRLGQAIPGLRKSNNQRCHVS